MLFFLFIANENEQKQPPSYRLSRHIAIPFNNLNILCGYPHSQTKRPQYKVNSKNNNSNYNTIFVCSHYGRNKSVFLLLFETPNNEFCEDIYLHWIYMYSSIFYIFSNILNVLKILKKKHCVRSRWPTEIKQPNCSKLCAIHEHQRSTTTPIVYRIWTESVQFKQNQNKSNKANTTSLN